MLRNDSTKYNLRKLLSLVSVGCLKLEPPPHLPKDNMLASLLGAPVLLTSFTKPEPQSPKP